MSTSTPLSDAIADLHARDDTDNYERLLRVFVASRLGVIVESPPAGAEFGSKIVVSEAQPIACNNIELPDGRSMLLACADRAVFVTRFDRPFNAELDAPSLMAVVLANPGCGGVLINSATSENSAIVTRSDIERLVVSRKPWWRFW